MDKKLPKVFVNQIDKKLDNNKKVFYSNKEEVIEKSNMEKLRDRYSLNLQTMDIQQKIRNIFNSPRYIYKANLSIKLKSGNVTKQVVGRNRNHLITIDNELIPIADIVDIDFVD